MSCPPPLAARQHVATAREHDCLHCRSHLTAFLQPLPDRPPSELRNAFTARLRPVVQGGRARRSEASGTASHAPDSTWSLKLQGRCAQHRAIGIRALAGCTSAGQDLVCSAARPHGRRRLHMDAALSSSTRPAAAVAAFAASLHSSGLPRRLVKRPGTLCGAAQRSRRSARSRAAVFAAARAWCFYQVAQPSSRQASPAPAFLADPAFRSAPVLPNSPLHARD